jgi:hypothetical protein
MRNVMMVMAMMCWCLGCGSGLKVVIVQPLDESDTLASKAVILSLANQPQAEEVKTPDAVACKCGGTGRSGDGLGPCACPDGCSCKVNRAEPVAEEPDEAEFVEETVEEEPVPDPVDAAEQVEATEMMETDQRVADAVERLTGLSERLAENQVGFVSKMEEFEERLLALEQPVVQQVELGKTEAAKTPAIVNQLWVFTKMDGSCPPCTQFDTKEVPALIDAGWSVGRDATYNIVLCDVSGEMSDEDIERYEPYKKFGTPYFAYFKAGQFQKGYAGYTTARKLSNDFNEIIKRKPPSVSQSSATLSGATKDGMEVFLYDTRKLIVPRPSSRRSNPSFGAYYRIVPQDKSVNSSL